VGNARPGRRFAVEAVDERTEKAGQHNAATGHHRQISDSR
jgi:hypothetical protein